MPFTIRSVSHENQINDIDKLNVITSATHGLTAKEGYTPYFSLATDLLILIEYDDQPRPIQRIGSFHCFIVFDHSLLQKIHFLQNVRAICKV